MITKKQFIKKKLIQIVDNIYLKFKGMKYTVELKKYGFDEQIDYTSYINMGTFFKPSWIKAFSKALNERETRATAIMSCKKNLIAYKSYKKSLMVICENGWLSFNKGTVDFHNELMNSKD